MNEEGEYVLSQIAERKEATNLLSEDVAVCGSYCRYHCRSIMGLPPGRAAPPVFPLEGG